MPAVPPTLLHTLLLYGLLLFEQKTPVYILLLEQKAPIYIAVRVPPAGSRRQTLSSRLIGAVAFNAELLTLDAPRVIIRDGRSGACDSGRSGCNQSGYD
jgi:hypothetical protein